jgi:hypothetical protein
MPGPLLLVYFMLYTMSVKEREMLAKSVVAGLSLQVESSEVYLFYLVM